MDAFDVLREFIEDIEGEYPSSQDDSGINVERLNWPDLMITYRRAKIVLAEHEKGKK